MSIRGKKNFQNGKIYQITSHCGDKIYIGSTTKKYLSQRMDRHRSNYKYWKQEKVNNVTVFDMFDEYGVENCQILLLELCPCVSNDELTSREAYYIRTLNCVNKVIPGRTKKEYRDTHTEQMKQYRDKNKEQILEYKKQHYENNRELILEQNKQYSKTKITCECGSNICKGSSFKHNKSIKHQQYLKTQLPNPM